MNNLYDDMLTRFSKQPAPSSLVWDVRLLSAVTGTWRVLNANR